MKSYLYRSVAVVSVAAGSCLAAARVNACNQTTGVGVGKQSDAGGSILNGQQDNVGIYEKIDATTWELRDSWYDPSAGRLPDDIWVPAGGGSGGGGTPPPGDGGGTVINSCADTLDRILVTGTAPGGLGGLGLWITRVNVIAGGGSSGGSSYSGYQDQGVVPSGVDPRTCAQSSQGDRNMIAYDAIMAATQNNPQRGTYSIRFDQSTYQNFIVSRGAGGAVRVYQAGPCSGP